MGDSILVFGGGVLYGIFDCVGLFGLEMVDEVVCVDVDRVGDVVYVVYCVGLDVVVVVVFL